MKKLLTVLMLVGCVLASQFYGVGLHYERGELTQTSFTVVDGSVPFDEDRGLYSVVGDNFRVYFTPPIFVSEGKNFDIAEEADYVLSIPAEKFDSSSEVWVEDFDGNRVLTLQKPAEPEEFVRPLTTPKQETAPVLPVEEEGGESIVQMIISFLRKLLSFLESNQETLEKAEDVARETQQGIEKAQQAVEEARQDSEEAQRRQTSQTQTSTTQAAGVCGELEAELEGLAAQAYEKTMAGEATFEIDDRIEEIDSEMMDNSCYEGQNRAEKFVMCRSQLYQYRQAKLGNGPHSRLAAVFLKFCFDNNYPANVVIPTYYLPEGCTGELTDYLEAACPTSDCEGDADASSLDYCLMLYAKADRCETQYERYREAYEQYNSAANKGDYESNYKTKKYAYEDCRKKNPL